MNAPLRIKTTKCKICREPFIKFRIEQKTCLNTDCLVTQGNIEAVKREAKAARAERADIKARLLDLKKPHYWHKRAQDSVNALRRAQDLAAGYGCITCGTFDAEEWHAGHFISVGACSTERFTHTNIHLQCRQCNYFGAGKATEYEARLPARIGQAEVDRLKNSPRLRIWSREECMAIEADAKRQLKELTHG